MPKYSSLLDNHCRRIENFDTLQRLHTLKQNVTDLSLISFILIKFQDILLFALLKGLLHASDYVPYTVELN